jgi:peptidoglycan/xylan/chitin deacetylase (PgdA/CDA1 family)
MLPPGELRAHVEYLLRRRYEFVTAAEFAQRLQSRARLHGVCALTFDDGSVDNATILPGLLAALGVPATLFVCPGLLGRPHPWLLPETGVRLMNADELKAVSQLGFIEIGSHTVSHADLEQASEEEAYRDMAESKAALEDLIGKPVPSFAYPFGNYSPACPRAAQRAGYTSAATCGTRGGWSAYELRRELVDAGDWRARFVLKAWGAFRPLTSSPPARLRRGVRAALAGQRG